MEHPVFSGRKLVCGISACQEAREHRVLSWHRLPGPQTFRARRRGTPTSAASVSLRWRISIGARFKHYCARRVELDADPTIPPRPGEAANRGRCRSFLARGAGNEAALRCCRTFGRSPDLPTGVSRLALDCETPETRARRLKNPAALRHGRRNGPAPARRVTLPFGGVRSQLHRASALRGQSGYLLNCITLSIKCVLRAGNGIKNGGRLTMNARAMVLTGCEPESLV